MTLGNRIRTEREAQGWTLNAFAKRADISPAYLSQLENGKSTDPSIQIAFKIAAALQTTVLHLFKGEHPQQTCENFQFFDDTGISKLRGFCRRYPPQVYYDLRAKDFDFGMPEKQPSVHIDDWCGEWQPKQ